MLNHGAKKAALKRLESAKDRHDDLVERIVSDSVALQGLRCAVYEGLVQTAEAYVSELAGAPRELVDAVTELRIEHERFDDRLEELKRLDESTTAKAGSTAGAGVVAGVGVAAFAPSAAMAVAMTFGTASTGTAISTLTGAAATNAALAWLGGGALAAGGGGMAGGQALLALAGPIGWTIGGAALVGAATWAHVKNKNIAKEANDAAIQLEWGNRKLVRGRDQIREIGALTREHADGANAQLAHLRDMAPTTYALFDDAQKKELAAFINSVRALGELLARAPSVS